MYRKKILFAIVMLLMLMFLSGIFYYIGQEENQEYGKRSILVWMEENDR